MNLDRNQAYNIFNELSGIVSKEIINFTKSNKLDVIEKEDRTLVTKCDKHIDTITGNFAITRGFSVISEERENNLSTLRNGNYLIIDAIDGTKGYIKHTQSSKDDSNPTINKELDTSYDYSFLTAIIADGKPRFGLCYNYVTGEKILLDSKSNNHTIWENKREVLEVKNAHYVDNRSIEDKIQKSLSKEADKTYYYSSPGLNFLYAQLRSHESSVIYHFAQQNGLWDIAPACVAVEFSGAEILDGNGKPINFTNYLDIPNKGLVLVKGDKFSHIKEKLKKIKI